MGKPLIMVSSVTYAMKGRQLLSRYGIRSDIVRTPSHIRESSCGYSLYVPKRTDEAQRILEEAGIRVAGRMERENVP